MRLYGLFQRKPGEKKWTRLFPSLAYRKATAIRVWQNYLLGGSMNGLEMALRPISDKPVRRPDKCVNFADLQAQAACV